MREREESSDGVSRLHVGGVFSPPAELVCLNLLAVTAPDHTAQCVVGSRTYAVAEGVLGPATSSDRDELKHTDTLLTVNSRSQTQRPTLLTRRPQSSVTDCL